MLKALFLDMDETLCDTTAANLKARDLFREKAAQQCGPGFNARLFADEYLQGIYKNLSAELAAKLLPVIDEEQFRTDLLAELYKNHDSPHTFSRGELHDMRRYFDDNRLKFFDFFPGVKKQLTELRKSYTLIVITNGPIYSQHPKVKRVNLSEYVDHIIIGGEEPQEKPHLSIFEKACRLADCKPHEAAHFGDSLEADIKGAANAGVHSVWISPGGKLHQDADHTISNFIYADSVLSHYH
jgi:N-acylneuraminate-9-phosphatase